ncbi:NapC/NirT family cytochrome c [Ferrimonas lipolytica]|uniref:Cytochrome c-type protein n=1 Tax=Ferrimonas lipolytica TaxID=2724191 RepID=A0A6H1UCD7_9GAMM|nr:NapC/NirT family cytochrome c [Ferrimonas lipolytica]QIZ76023.1 cytochrome C [Ferrimonas lipolytica]
MSEPEQGIWKKPKTWWLFGIPLGGFIALIVGALLWIGFETSLEVTSTDKFCTSCHNSPSQFVAAEMQHLPHRNNASGVIATCHDCHIPHEFFPKLWVKATSAATHVTHHLMGEITTKEEFESNRLRMAEKVWAHLEQSDSHECRSCHKVEEMNVAKQSETAAQYHDVLKDEDGPTCISCHKGIAHQLPQGW